MHATVRMRVRFRETSVTDGLKELLRALDIGSTRPLTLPRAEKVCDHHANPEVVTVQKVPGATAGEYEILLALPVCLAGSGGGIAMLLSSICYCSVFSRLERLAVLDINLPTVCLSEYLGPRHGIAGIRARCVVSRRPLLGVIVKPRLRPDLPSLLSMLRLALEAGVDYVVDDELLLSPYCCPFGERVAAISDLVRAVRDKQSRSIQYFANVTADVNIALEHVHSGIEAGVSGFSLNCVTMGFSAVRYIIDEFDGKAVFIVNNIGRGVLTRPASHYIAERVVATLSRLAGADAVYTGPFTKDYAYDVATLSEEMDALRSELGHIKSAFAVSSGSISPQEVLANIDALGMDVMLQMGSSLFEDQGRVQTRVRALTRVLDSLTERPQEDELLAEVRNILGPRSSHSNEREALRAKSPPSHVVNRLADVEDNLKRELQLLKRTEDAERLSDRPQEKTRLGNELLDIRRRLLGAALEWENLTSSGVSSARTARACEDARGSIVAAFNSQLAQIPNSDLQLFAAEAQQCLEAIGTEPSDAPSAPHEIQEARRQAVEVLESSATVADKLKITIPIIPLLLKYEGEIAFTSKAPIRHLWDHVVRFVQGGHKEREQR